MECCSTAGLAHLLRFLRNPEVQMNGRLNELGERLRRSYVNLSRSCRYGRVCSSLHNIRLVQPSIVLALSLVLVPTYGWSQTQLGTIFGTSNGRRYCRSRSYGL